MKQIIKLQKKISLAIILLASITAKAQITLEQSFAAADFYAAKYYYINFTQAGAKYLKSVINNTNHTDSITIYNTDYSVYKSFVLNMPYEIAEITNISDNLFNSDSKIEVAIQTYYSGNNPYNTGAFIISQEDDTQVFRKDSVTLGISAGGGGLISSAATSLQYGGRFINTATGWKMYLPVFSNPSGGSSPTYIQNVYSLPGTQQITAVKPSAVTDPFNLSNPFPNPSSEMATINFKLPASANQGQIVVYNEMGELVKTLTVDNTFGRVLLNNSGLTAGTYYYLIKAGNETSDTKKMVVVP